MRPVAGFVLVGGQSSRMGSDKAMLEDSGLTLLDSMAARVRQAVGNVTVIGPSERYPEWNPVADRRPGCGPLGGIETALAMRLAEWNLIVAVDMPLATAGFLSSVVRAAQECDGDCLVPLSPEGRAEPLCAVWRHTSLAAVQRTLDAGVRKVTGVFDDLPVSHFIIDNQKYVTNLNTPADWQDYLRGKLG